MTRRPEATDTGHAIRLLNQAQNRIDWGKLGGLKAYSALGRAIGHLDRTPSGKR